MGNTMQFLLNQAMNNPQMKSNPIAKHAMELFQNGDTENLRLMAENLCRENHTTPEEVKEKLLRGFNFR